MPCGPAQRHRTHSPVPARAPPVCPLLRPARRARGPVPDVRDTARRHSQSVGRGSAGYVGSAERRGCQWRWYRREREHGQAEDNRDGQRAPLAAAGNGTGARGGSSGGAWFFLPRGCARDAGGRFAKAGNAFSPAAREGVQAVADAYSARLRLLREVETLWTECYLPKGTGKWRRGVRGVPSDIMDAWRRMQKDTGIVPAMRDCLLKPMNDMGVQEWRTRVAEIGKCQKCTASWSQIATSIREFCEGKCPHIVSNSVKAPAPARETVTSQRQTATKKSAAAPALQLEALTAPTPPPPPAPASQVQNTEHEAIRSGVAMALAAYYCSTQY